MKITAVHAHVLEAQLSEPFAYSRMWYAKRMSMIVEVATDDGLTGWGECYGPAHINAAVVRELGTFLVGQDPLRTEYLWHELYARFRDHGQKGVVIQGLSGIDIALWDLKGKALGQPIHRLMGGPVRETVQAYATGLYRRDRPNHAAYLCEEALESRDLGFTAMKLKVGFGVADDVRAVHAVRAAIGPEIGLMIDANHAYDAVEAIRLGRRIEDADIGWFEEPVPPEDLDGHAAVKAALSIPVATGECEFTRIGFRALLERRAADIIQPDLCAAGGLSEGKKIADMALAFGVRFAPHVWGTGVAVAAAVQLLAVVPAWTPPSLSPVEPMLEFDRTEHPVRSALLQTPIAPVNGAVAVPAGPGLGIEVDRDALVRFKADR
ncbi:MAG TPA: mandelate racemase/muconate lactonizing enzyme family protein [Rhodopila sp.]|uniref:mandelate racemase/muconate lactonizing enzyme family protein n=1 Tax=Rhodopila sp. TaxID=2480087 RepID=UPI002CDCF1A6|nr:mandelate racemase/muconate lactonizing enzyme family protein [Rhodopila sp.]HVY16797.1 mandelate racemase/muconate lactonizing enzyme family protein [Rhodopila sp.]